MKIGRYHHHHPVTRQQREKHLEQLQLNLAQLEAVRQLPDMPGEWFAVGGVEPGYLALETPELAEAMDVERGELIHLAYYADSECMWHEDDREPSNEAGRAVWDRLDAKFGDRVDPGRLPEDMERTKRRIEHERRKLAATD